MSRNTLAALALIALTAPSHAEQAPAPQSTQSDFTLSANVTLASQYRYRGLMQTNNKPAIQGGFDGAFQRPVPGQLELQHQLARRQQ